MICYPCKRAAEMARAPEVTYQNLNGPQETLTGPEAAVRLHAQCPERARQLSGLTWPEALGSTLCDCQHKLPVPPPDEIAVPR